MSKKILLLPAPRMLKVNSVRNSECYSSALSTLDFSEWWTDCSFEQFYLHVRHRDRNDGSIHRVYCRHTEKPRLKMKDGVLYWLVEREQKA